MKLEKFLKITLVAQLILLIFITYPSNKNVKNNYFLSHFKTDSVSAIVLQEQDKKLELIKEHDIWLLKDKFKFPANQEKVGNFLDSIINDKNIKRIGKSENALEKFKLTEKNFVEKISLFENNKEEIFFLGDTPEFKKVYIRNIKDNESFVANLSKFDLGTDWKIWRQKDFLGFSKDLIKKISFNKFSLIKNDNNFTVEDLKDKNEIDSEKLDFLLNKLFSISFLDILSENKISLDKPDFKIDFLKEDGSNVTLNFKKIDNKFILKVSSMPWDFEISKNLFNDFKEIKKEEILK